MKNIDLTKEEILLLYKILWPNLAVAESTIRSSKDEEVYKNALKEYDIILNIINKL